MSAVARGDPLKSPYPWFGGKRLVADVVWRAFGDVSNYVEPFFGSGAVLLARPGGAGKIETINDLDGGVCNFWRAVQKDPEAVAYWCDYPVNEIDLHARHKWLVERIADLRERLVEDPDFYDPKFAGWWVWGIALWIGGGWCTERRAPHEQAPHLSGFKGVHRKLPDLYVRGHGRGVRAASSERGEHDRDYRPSRQPRPNAKNRGVLAGMPNLGNTRRGVHRDHAPPCTEWFTALQERLARVRVVSGDWSRVCRPSVVGNTRVRNTGMVPCGVFLDPPYDTELRDRNIYSEDQAGIARQVAQWAIEHGHDLDLRIALCGLEGEHDMPDTWTKHEWRGQRGYGKSPNRERERIWFSPGCLPIDPEPKDDLVKWLMDKDGAHG